MVYLTDKLTVAMDLLSLLVALAFDRIDQSRTSVRLLSTLIASLCGGWGIPGVIALVSATFLTHGLLLSLSSLLGGIFGAAVLIVCLGLGELINGVSEYLTQRLRGDEQNACRLASALIGRQACDGGVRLAREMLAGVLVEGHARGVGLLFWYIFLGPAGALLAVLMRRVALPNCMAGNTSPLAGTLYWIIDWLPARLSALSYGLAGSLTHALGNWRARAWNWDSPNTVVLVASGTGALLLETETSGDSLSTASSEEQDTAVKNALALVTRALVVWVTAVGLVTLGGWLK
ncbi:conserved membrane hypothetical protein [Gammaproteobacteria bacterium]